MKHCLFNSVRNAVVKTADTDDADDNAVASPSISFRFTIPRSYKIEFVSTETFTRLTILTQEFKNYT